MSTGKTKPDPLQAHVQQIVKCVDEAKSLSDTAFAHQVFDGSGDILEAAPTRNFKPEMFGE